MNQLELPGAPAQCLRCGAACRTGRPDPKARAIRVAANAGFCANCIVTKFLLSIESIAEFINGAPARGSKRAGLIIRERSGVGPEIFLDRDWRHKTFGPHVVLILAHTQLPPEQIDWIEVVGNWGLPWPKGREPKPADY